MIGIPLQTVKLLSNYSQVRDSSVTLPKNRNQKQRTNNIRGPLEQTTVKLNKCFANNCDT